MLSEFNAEEIDYLVVGACAMAAHACPRGTGDIEFRVRPSRENAVLAYRALARYGAPLDRVTADDFAVKGTIFQVGVVPLRIDVLTMIDGIEVDEAWPNRVLTESGGLPVKVIGRHDLLRNKLATGRSKDKIDAAMLMKQKAKGR